MTDFNDTPQKRRSGRLLQKNSSPLTGLFLVFFGVAFLMKNLDTDFPRWMFRWETLVFFLGLYVGIRNKFKGAGWFIMMAIAGTSLLDEFFPVFERPQFTWAVVAIIVGLYFIFRPKQLREDNWDNCKNEDSYEKQSSFTIAEEGERFDAEKLDVAAVFGSVKKVVVSKRFKGGEIVSVMGGTHIDLSQADIQGTVALEATNIMGGTKLIIPSNWDVRSEMVAIFGGVEDKRDVHALKTDRNKILVLEGTCIFGGLEIRNF
jgi:predicted membrane protein